MVQKILTPLDGSRNASVALEVAADITAKSGAHLKLLHVGMRQPGPLTELYKAAERSFERAEKSGDWTSDYPNWTRQLQVLAHMGHMILDKGQACARDRGATSVEAVIDWGDEGERILHHSKHPAVDMIVMGSRGASALKGLFLGSVSHKVFHLAQCTCVTVHAAEGQSGFGELERICVPFDGSSHAIKAVELACDIAEKFSAGLNLVLVLEGGETPDHLLAAIDRERLDAETLRALDEARTPERPAMGPVGAMPMVSRNVLRKVGEEILAHAKRTAAHKGITKVETALLEGDPTHCILEAVEQDRADLVVMGMRGLGEVTGMLAGSVSYKVNHLAPCTCITVRFVSSMAPAAA